MSTEADPITSANEQEIAREHRKQARRLWQQ